MIQVLSGQYDPRTSPGVAAIIEAMEGSVGRAVLEPMMQRLAMAGQGPGTPMAQATAEAGRLLAGEVGRLLQDAYARELQAALGLAGMSTDAATKAAQLEMQGRELELRGKALELQAQIAQAELGLRNAQARANYELARYGMISEQTYRDYMAELTKWQRLAEMATGIMGAYLPPPQYGPPPIVGILGALAPFLS
ncbi:MAG: hypothetical protein NZ902_06545 [Acidilobaceae archaeon]|nr:hypothetical protein [Acidilobaceae archaeon]MDW7974878.1 hypothetical protein [Sulfolobales archaeon]